MMIPHRMKIVIVIIIAVVFSGCSMSGDTKSAEQAVTSFHQMLDAGQIDAIYEASADDLKKVTTHERFVTFLGSVHSRLGNTKSSSVKKWLVNYNTSGKFVTLTYSTTYDGGNTAEEFVYRLQDGKALLAGYHID